MSRLELRAMQPDEWPDVAALIHASTNAWYVAQHKPPVFACEPRDVESFCRVYEALDPGCCVVAVEGGRIVGSCFYHPRPTHVSLGIMNAAPACFGQGVARRLLAFVIDVATAAGLPLRLVSSAMNLDSFSLYNREGFRPYAVYQDMLLRVPPGGVYQAPVAGCRLRDATPDDVGAMVELERSVAGLDRGRDFAYFVANADGIWTVSVCEAADGALRGFLVSVADPASNMLGPGVMRDDEAAAALIRRELDRHRGRKPVWLVPSDRPVLLAAMYDLGARNCELHLAQVLGDAQVPDGVHMPTFMPETG